MPDSPQTNPLLLGEFTWSVAELASRYAPRWSHPNKRAVAALVTAPEALHEGDVCASRWRAAELPQSLAAPGEMLPVAGFFSYPEPEPGDPTTHWHLNFADPYLFGYGEGRLLAQDELQIVEHPCLASIAYAIEEGEHGQPGLTRSTQEGEQATPVLIERAPRRCALDTTQLYGDNFAEASTSEVRAATRPIVPPTRSNILALSALTPAHGEYTARQIRQLLQRAYAGFRALTERSGRVTLHTGYWGCGAFGGNKGLVSALQLLAAGAAGVERVCFWWGFTELDRSALEHAVAVAHKLDGADIDDAVERLAAAGYRWGQANENYVPYEPPKRCLL